MREKMYVYKSTHQTNWPWTYYCPGCDKSYTVHFFASAIFYATRHATRCEDLDLTYP